MKLKLRQVSCGEKNSFSRVIPVRAVHSPLPGPRSKPGTVSYCYTSGASPTCGPIFFIHVKNPSSTRYLSLHFLLSN
ncbi:hypothetical protein BDA96_04G272400 [Sorghum bicolor]|uniref:Uncharacterized protein n=2 Tax=Sorghum bicolor TaxID=4558 RepID=A0A921R6W2_SORBI|nr:hypothetical protein BDA96_04G272400 [Sorghum bicolor]OQU85492.1 hypothetical protein SORBI_3004G255550 [Sorghum bicolor]